MIRPTLTRHEVSRQHQILDEIEIGIGGLLKALNLAESPGESDAMLAWQEEVVGRLLEVLPILDPEWQGRKI